MTIISGNETERRSTNESASIIQLVKPQIKAALVPIIILQVLTVQMVYFLHSAIVLLAPILGIQLQLTRRNYIWISCSSCIFILSDVVVHDGYVS